MEPFAGGLAVLLAKPPSRIEVLNDINGDLVNFYRCLRFHADALLTELEFVLSSRREFTDFIDQPGLTDIQRAARWFFRNRNCFRGADLETFGTSSISARGSREARLDSIRLLNRRLDRVTIENLDWERCLTLYDRAETLFFCDPPYTSCQAGVYNTWKISDVLRFRQALDRLRGHWIVTFNDTPEIRQIFADCPILSVARSKGISQVKEKIYRELIISSPASDAASHRLT